ncbi:uncharacterized protein LOC126902740 [Daktulosphaira vitifoliae]|uniref:uncharacterized protein LOC126902740 n=1 Tax=Daktulosphaira vitifoliae TaxID=58002 RepID=UPI0021AAE478|nr:uncharacterized protein LOC126902740 [Daktulosphaira vitifoliae]
MSIFLSIKLYILIFSILMYIQIVNSLKDRINFLFKNDGWKNLTDVEYIINYNVQHTLQETLETPVTSNNYDTHIRSATIILGCSYANVLKTIFFIMDRFLEYCETLISSENENKYAYDCTIELINTMPNLSYLATLMKGALVSIDKLHRRPMVNNKRLILNDTTTRLCNKGTLNILLPTQINRFNTEYALKSLKNYLAYNGLSLKNDLRYCKLKYSDLDLLWQNFNTEYEFLEEKVNKEKLWSFICHKIKHFIDRTVTEKYNNLGFKFNSITKQTILLTKTPRKNEPVNSCHRNQSLIKINNLFKHSGWKNMTDVNYITYSRNNHTLQDITKNTYRYDKQIRCLTLLLGCSYANILNNIFIVLSNFQNHCKHYSSHLDNLNNYKYECTIELLKTIPFITSLVILMGSALDALDKIPKSPVENNHIKKFTSNTLIKDLQDEKILKLLPDLQVYQSNTDETLLKILSFVSEWIEELNKGMIICNINSESLTSFIKKIDMKYHNMQLNGINIQFYKFLNFKIASISQWAVQEKYINLGFEFNADTNETFIPVLQKSPDEEIFNFEETKNKHEPEDNSPLLLNIPENIRPVNKYL